MEELNIFNLGVNVNENTPNNNVTPTIIKNDTQSRNWCFVVNNPKLTDQQMFEYLKTLSNMRYFIFVKEKGDGTENSNGTEHHQGYIEFSTPKKFSTIKNFLSNKTIGVNAHIQPRQTTKQTVISYIKKEDKFENKAHTRLTGPFEFGELTQMGRRTDLIDMVDMRIQGATTKDVFEAHSGSYARYNSFVESMAMEYKTEKYQTNYRDNLEVIYIYGPTRTGKTKYVFDKHGYSNVYKAQGYEFGKWFDNYTAQPVLLLDEYHSNFSVDFLLQLLDGHPLCVQCRYKNRWACFEKVYIISNIPLDKQYIECQVTDKETWKALLARISKIYEFTELGKPPIEHPIPIQKTWLGQVNPNEPF